MSPNDRGDQQAFDLLWVCGFRCLQNDVQRNLLHWEEIMPRNMQFFVAEVCTKNNFFTFSFQEESSEAIEDEGCPFRQDAKQKR